jgi:hypothetical protein
MRKSGRIAATCIAAVVAGTSLYWLVWNVDRHSEHIRQDLAAHLTHNQLRPVRTVSERIEERAEQDPLEGGFDIIDVCYQPLPDAKGWLGLWFVTALIGGAPTAVLVRSRTAPGRD